MKIKINYDLISKISEGDKGFSLKKTGMKVLGFTSAVMVYRSIITSESQNNLAAQFLGLGAFYTVLFGTMDILCSNIYKKRAIETLKSLSKNLKMIDINTNEVLLLKAYKYKTDYDISFNKFYFPKLEQKKYIIVPVYDDGKEKEVSLVQEHIVGTDEYILSYGEPKKILKLAYN